MRYKRSTIGRGRKETLRAVDAKWMMRPISMNFSFMKTPETPSLPKLDSTSPTVHASKSPDAAAQNTSKTPEYCIEILQPQATVVVQASSSVNPVNSNIAPDFVSKLSQANHVTSKNITATSEETTDIEAPNKKLKNAKKTTGSSSILQRGKKSNQTQKKDVQQTATTRKGRKKRVPFTNAEAFSLRQKLGLTSTKYTILRNAFIEKGYRILPPSYAVDRLKTKFATKSSQNNQVIDLSISQAEEQRTKVLNPYPWLLNINNLLESSSGPKRYDTEALKTILI
jgi:hypothetical protein